MSIDVDNSASSKVVGAKLDGTFENYFEVMIHKHKTSKVLIQDCEDIIILNSFIGAESLRSKDNIITVISFSSSLFTPRLIQERYIQAGSSFNILTWMQICATGTLDVLKVVLLDYFEVRKKLVNGTI